jgi:hypothetical protein
MSLAQYTPNEYLIWIQTSNRRHLLVEGRDDKRIFERLMEGFLGNQWRDEFEIDIDTAQGLINGEELDRVGNRDKVEYVCSRVNNADFAERLLGFVDREYRGFRFGGEFLDEIGGHNVIGRLIWSRGHSVENYFFDFTTLRDPLVDFSTTDYLHQAITLLENLFESTIRLACAASLTGQEIQNLNIIKSSIDWKVIEIENQTLRINLNTWKEILIEKMKLPMDRSNRIIDLFNRWSNSLRDVDFTIIRWLCHGHIGLTFIWAVYARCVFEVCSNPNPRERAREPTRVLRAEESVRFNACAGSWARRSLRGECDYPSDVFRMLGISEEI